MSEESPFLPESDDEPDDLPTPWGFRITLVAAGIYLLYRLGQFVFWLFERFF